MEALNDINITREEVDRFTKAFKNDEFKKMFVEYINEMNDPENKRRYEAELTQLEAEHGIDVTFINPEPGFVIKTSVNGEKKAFINVCKCDRVNKPTSQAKVEESGQRGLNWSIPYTQAPPRDDIDNKKATCLVYDVVFHPDTLYLGEKDPRFRQLVCETACDAVQSAYGVKIDMSNLKFPKLPFKGAVRPTIIRKKREDFVAQDDDDDDFLKNIYPKMKEPVKPDKPIQRQLKFVHEEYAKPKFQITHRRDVDYEELTDELDAKINLTVPKQLIITVDLPLLNSTGDVTLDVTKRQIYLISERPAKYKLIIPLPYDVDDNRGSAKFDKMTRKLIIILPVIRSKTITIREICREDSGVESDLGTPKNECWNCFLSDVCPSGGDDQVQIPDKSVGKIKKETKNFEETSAVTTFLDPGKNYTLPTFTCHSIENNLAFTLHVKNIQPSSIIHEHSSTWIQLKFTSIGSGYFPMEYAFFFNTNNDSIWINGITVEPWDNNVIVQIELSSDSLVKYLAGLDRNSVIEYQIDKLFDISGRLSSAVKSTEMIDVTVTPSEDKIKIKISPLTSEEIDKNPLKCTTVNKKPSQKKNRKARSLSESHCDELKALNNVIETSEQSAIVIHRLRSPVKTRSFSESSNDEPSRCLKSILKRRISLYTRSTSESSADDQGYSCSYDFGSFERIPEETTTEMSGSRKKTVRFDQHTHRLLFKQNSTILGQRKPKTNKRKKKKNGQQERSHSEGEGSDYEIKEKPAEMKIRFQRSVGDIGVELNKVNGGNMLSDQPKTRKEKRKNRSNDDTKNPLIFDIDL